MMTVPHEELCREKRSSYRFGSEYCECGSLEIQNRLNKLEDEREVIQRLIESAETIVIESIGAPYTPRMVFASDLEDILSGRMR